MKKVIKILFILIFLILLTGTFLFIRYKCMLKENHKVIFTILSDGEMECGYVSLVFYDDNTYAFFYKADPRAKPIVGTYSGDAIKALNKIRNGELDDSGSKHGYIVVDTADNKYIIGDENEILRGIPFQKIRVNLNTCPKQ